MGDDRGKRLALIFLILVCIPIEKSLPEQMLGWEFNLKEAFNVKLLTEFQFVFSDKNSEKLLSDLICLK